MDCEKTLELILDRLQEETRLRKTPDGECLMSLPFRDNAGDPLEISISSEGKNVTIDDAVDTTGLPFSLGQHTQDAPAIKLLRDLEHTHGLQADFQEGLLKICLPEGNDAENNAENDT